MKEQWAELEEWPGYLVSNTGLIYSKRRDRLLKASINSKGYFQVGLTNSDGWKSRQIHRLVAIAFVPGQFDGAVVNHIDGNKQNNHASNLEWITNADNVRHAFALGLNPTRKRKIVAIYDNGKLTKVEP